MRIRQQWKSIDAMKFYQKSLAAIAESADDPEKNEKKVSGKTN